MAEKALVLWDYWQDRIERDIAPFIDPGTTLHLARIGRSYEAQWMQRGELRSAIFAGIAEGNISVLSNGTKCSYRAFFASPEMGNLTALAKMILQAQRERLYVETKAERLDDGAAATGPAISILTSVLEDKYGEDATLIVMVTGDAGAGKTSVLQQLVRQRAEQYLRGRSDGLLLYVNAQGRALARLSEAFATELQDLRATITYHSVATLARLGLLIPVIDGFDELIGVSGYDDAFSSLAAFLEELDGDGKIIASARSVYYEQEFVERANKVSSLGSQIWRQIPVKVLEWGQSEFDAYVGHRCSDARLASDATQVLRSNAKAIFAGANEGLRSKPFFVAKTIDLLLDSVVLAGDGDLLRQLVNAYIEREQSQKLRDKSGNPLVTPYQLKSLLVELAEEMWNQETRALDTRSVREVAEYVLLTEGVGEGARQIVIQRMPTLAFLSIGERLGSIGFEHETFFSYFLAHRFAERLVGSGQAVAQLMARAVLPDDLPNITIRILAEDGMLPDNRDILKVLSTPLSGTGTRAAQAQENAGRFATAILKRAVAPKENEGLELANMVFPGGDLHGVVLKSSKFSSVEFRRTDLSQTQFLTCAGSNLLLIEVLVNREATRLEVSGLDPNNQVLGLRVVEKDALGSVYDPKMIEAILVDVGAIPQGSSVQVRGAEVPDSVVGLVERLVRAYGRSNPVCVDDPFLAPIFQDFHWRKVERCLLTSGVATEEARSTSGASKRFLRRQVLPAVLMAGRNKDADVPESVRKFWDCLEMISRPRGG